MSVTRSTESRPNSRPSPANRASASDGSRRGTRTRPRVTCGENARGSRSNPSPASAASTRPASSTSASVPRPTPAQITRARAGDGYAPSPATFASNAVSPAVARVSATTSSGVSASRTRPRNRSVRWRFSGATQATSRATRRSPSMAAPSAARTASSSRIATNVLISSIALTRQQRAPKQIKGRLRRLPLHRRPVADEPEVAARHPSRGRERDEHRADRFRGRAALGAGDPGDREAAGRPGARTDAAHHRLGARRAHRAVVAQDLRRYAEQLLLRAVRVDEHTALEVRGRPGDVREPVAEEPARARFGDRERQAALEQEPTDDELERLRVAAVAVVAQRLEDRRLGAAQGARRLGGRRSARAEPHPYLAVARKHGEVDGSALGRPEPLRQAILDLAERDARGAEHPHQDDAAPREAGAGEGHEVLGEGRGEAGGLREDRKRPRAALERPARLASVDGPGGGALRQEGEAFGPARHRPVEAPVALLQRGEKPLAQDEPRAHRAREDVAHHVARRPAATRDHDREPVVRGERPLERRLVLVEDDAARHRHARLRERRGDGGALRVGERRAGYHADRHDPGDGGHGQRVMVRRSPRTMAA